MPTLSDSPTHLYSYGRSRHTQYPLCVKPVLLQALDGLVDEERDLHMVHSLSVELHQDLQRDSKHAVVYGRERGRGEVEREGEGEGGGEGEGEEGKEEGKGDVRS